MGYGYCYASHRDSAALARRAASATSLSPTSRRPKTHRKMKEALELVGGQLGHEYDLIIGGQRLKTEGKIQLARILRGRRRWSACTRRPGAEHAEQAMQAALRAFESWSRTSVEERTSLLLGAAEIIRRAQVRVLRVAHAMR